MVKHYEVLRADRAADKSLKIGDVVYDTKGHDYGLANDDTRLTGIEHISLTLNSDGDYPFFTIPKADVRELPDTYYREVNAQWHSGDDRLAISCVEFKVVKRTPKGVWIAPTWAQTEDYRQYWKFILHSAGKKYAYPTREEARRSFIIRKEREIQHTARQHDRAVRYLALAKTMQYGTRTEALHEHEIMIPDILLPEAE